MSPRSFSASIWLILSFAVLAHCSVEFFLNEAFDECSKDNIDIQCSNNTFRGGLCAYAQDVSKLWCCPAGDETCWASASDCSGGSSGAPGRGQISCSNQGTEWCCDQEYETCTQGEDQINVCISKFANANKDVSIADANAIESSRAPDKGATSTTLSGLLGIPSTSIPDAIPAITSASASASASASVSVSSPSPTAIESKSSLGLSTGAIAGIVVGAVIVILSVIAIFILRARHARRATSQTEKEQLQKANGAWELESESPPSELDGKKVGPELPAQEMRHELR